MQERDFPLKRTVEREYVHCQISVARNNITSHVVTPQKFAWHESDLRPLSSKELIGPENQPSAAPVGKRIPLYDAAHSRAGDKGNDLNFSIIPHYPPDIRRLKMIVMPNWVKEVLSPLLNRSSFPNSDDIERQDEWADRHVKQHIYEVKGIHSLNVVVRNIPDGGVNCSRRIDRHGKTISDVVLSQQLVLPP